PLLHALRVVGGAEATQGSHPWLVSLRKKSYHFCGGAILSARWIMTAAHCFSSTSESLRGVRVVTGNFDQRLTDEEEQVFIIKNISIHEKYHTTLPMNYDIALLELYQPIHLGMVLSSAIFAGKRVQPVCLPLPDVHTQPDTNCIVAGWGRTKEGHLSSTLREVQLNLVDPAKCKYVLQTVKNAILSPQRLNRLPPALTVLCAGPETGGRDACQGDSGGPLVCPVGSAGGHWVALGVTSWGKGCGRSWEMNSSRPPSQRGSPGVFTDVKLMLPWIKLTLRQCTVQDGSVIDTEGVIRNPASQHRYYNNNR
uniref:Peptidase S1 domain-containing protein n=1 Tax=Periophthalmus magnuspinnatus TaxID=409849 RepID=A0A3B4B990_9GOBI